MNKLRFSGGLTGFPAWFLLGGVFDGRLAMAEHAGFSIKTGIVRNENSTD